jgi:choline dehydrogenase-like flavoprotein
MNEKDAIHTPDALDAKDAYDVCIIGSGPAGTILGRELVARGVRTLIVESGSGFLQWLLNRRLRSLATYEFTGDTNYPLKNTKARILGGNSNFWTGRCERLHQSDFDRHPYTPPENPWPVTYDELAPFYESAENLFRVRGGKRSEYAPRRNGNLPLPPKPDISYLKSLFKQAGVVVDDSPTATPSKAIRFFKVQKEILPDFLSSPSATLVTGLTATRLLPDSNGRLVGAELHTLSGEKKIARAKIYVVACGGIETPRLLLLSRSEQFSRGIGNAHDMVGRGFNEHPSVNFYGKIPHELGTLMPTNKIGRSHQFYSDFRSEGLGSILPVFRQSWILPHHTMEFKLSNIPRNIRSTLSRLLMATLYIGVTIEQKISTDNRVTLSDRKKDIFGNPIAHLVFNYCDEDLMLLNRCRDFVRNIYGRLGAADIFETEVGWSRHHQGTCRMGDNPANSVIDRNLRVHECSNLYVCGSEVFVTGGAMQPLLSIAAFSLRLGEHLPGRLREE